MFMRVFLLLFSFLLLPLTAHAQSWPVQDTMFPDAYVGVGQTQDVFSTEVDLAQLPPHNGTANVFASAGFQNKQNGNIKIMANAGIVVGKCTADPNKPVALWLTGPTGVAEYHPSCFPRFSRVQLQVIRQSNGYTSFWWRNRTTGQECFFNKPNTFCTLSSGCAAITPMYPISRINVVRFSGPTYPYPVVITMTQPIRTGTTPITTGTIGGYTFPSPYLAPGFTWTSYRYDRVNP